MKKFLITLTLLLSVFMVTNAQIATENSKLFDNTYVSIEGGVTTPMDFDNLFPVNAVGGLKIGKEFTPVVGVELEGLAFFGNNGIGIANTFVRATNVGLNNTINLTNALFGYKGSPCVLEMKTNTGLGWLHDWDTPNNAMTAKTGLDLLLNLGKGNTLAVSPGILWNLTGNGKVQFNRSLAQFMLLASYTYHFKNSNETHSFKTYDVGSMMDEINFLREELNKKPAEVVVTEYRNVPIESIVTVDNSYIVTFAKGSYEISDLAMITLNSVPEGAKVRVSATASPEGTPEFNQALSQKRADAISSYLSARGVKVLSADGFGVVGDTSNRIAVITIQ